MDSELTIRLTTPAQKGAQIVASVLVMVGILGVLRTGVSQIDNPVGESMMFFTTHFLTGLVQVIVGLVGIGSAHRDVRARAFLFAVAVLMVTWVVACAVLRGNPNDMVAADAGLIGLNGAIAVAAVAALITSHVTGTRPAPDTAESVGTASSGAAT